MAKATMLVLGVCAAVAAPAVAQRKVYTNSVYDTISVPQKQTPAAKSKPAPTPKGGAMLVYEVGTFKRYGTYSEKFVRFAMHQGSVDLAKRLLAQHTAWDNGYLSCVDGRMVGNTPGNASYGRTEGACQSRVWSRGGYFAYATGHAVGPRGDPWFVNAVGTSTGLPSRDAAEAQALRNCQADGGSNCAVQYSALIGLKEPISEQVFAGNGFFTSDMFGLNTKRCDIYGQNCWMSNERR